MPRSRLILVMLVVACGEDTPSPTDAADVDAIEVDAVSIDGAVDAAAAFVLTSSTIVEGGVIPIEHSCRGANTSPALAWSGGQAAQGYALIFTDITTASGFLHSAMWDIPAGDTSIPANVPKVFMPPVPVGAKQPIGYDGSTRGYLGPCPNSMHRYEFALHAVDVYPLPGLSMTSSRATVRDVVLAHSIASATLTATFTP